MKRTLFYPNHVVGKRSLFCLLMFGFISVSIALADWSEPVLLWEDEPGGAQLAPVDAAIAVDAEENVHIVFTHHFVHPEHWEYGVLTQLSYTKFDSWGHQIVPETMLSGSVAVCSYPQIGLFGMDSLWAVWNNAGDWENEPRGIATRSLDLNGNLLRPVSIWTDSMFEGPLGYAFQILPDRSVVLAFSDVQPIIKTILVIHQRPDGTRILDHAPVFRNSVNGEATDHVYGYVDTSSDSLQIFWREAHLNIWQAIFGKRVSLQMPPVDSTNLEEHVALTPPTPGHVRGPGRRMRWLGDSLFIYNELRAEGILDETFLRVFRRSDYSIVSTAWIGSSNIHQWDVEPDGQSVSVVGTADPDTSSELHFVRFSLPNLVQIEDTMLAQNLHGQNKDYSIGYTVSPGGVRHLVLGRVIAPQYDTRQLYYRFWRQDLAVGPQPEGTGHAKPDYSITPNPATGHFIIEGPLARATSITLYNVLGQQVGRSIQGTDLRTQALSFSTHDLPAGAYFLHISTPTEMIIQKVIVVR
jgi:hypothetical protein